MRDINEYLDAKTVIIIVLAILVIVISVLCFRQWENITELSEMIDDESQKNLLYQNEIANLRKKQNDDSGNAFEEDIHKRMPPEPDEAGLIAGINSLCADTSCFLRDITFLSRNKRDAYLELPIKINLLANYYSLVQFLEGLGTSERFIQLTGLQITVNEEHDLLDISIGASAFSYTQ